MLISSTLIRNNKHLNTYVINKASFKRYDLQSFLLDFYLFGWNVSGNTEKEWNVFSPLVGDWYSPAIPVIPVIS